MSFFKDCPKRLNNKRNKPKIDSGATLAHNNEANIDEVYATVNYQPSQELILDSGCTFYMCSNRE